MGSGFTDITSHELRKYIREHREEEYILIDVRQPEEYSAEHIPGAALMPLATLDQEIGSISSTERDIIFSCRSGNRSRAAASFVVDQEIPTGNIYNLAGGILAWQGKKLPDFPKINLLGVHKKMEEMLLAAMELEKGTWNYYSIICEKFPDKPFTPTIKTLSMAEIVHAEALYEAWKKNQPHPPAFDELFGGLKGDILEGGRPLADLMEKLFGSGEDSDTRILELSLEIEYAAYDLYRSAAHEAEHREASGLLLKLAESEKAHILKVSEAFSLC